MHRMRRFLVTFALSALVLGSFARRAESALLHPTDTSQFPDLSAGYVSGTLQYSATTGELVVNNTPYALAIGSTAATQYVVTATSGGQQSQTIIAQINPDGTLNSSGANQYDLYGKVTVNGATYSGLLLQGKPTAFGSLDLSAAPTSLAGVGMFDMDIAVTGGQLASAFGSEAYLRLTAERGSTFNGSFTQDFSGYKIATNLRGYNPAGTFPTPAPAPVPEPTTLVFMIACGGVGLIFRRRRRITRADLEAAAG